MVFFAIRLFFSVLLLNFYKMILIKVPGLLLIFKYSKEKTKIMEAHETAINPNLTMPRKRFLAEQNAEARCKSDCRGT